MASGSTWQFSNSSASYIKKTVHFLFSLKDSIEGKLLNCDSHTVNLGVKDCEDTVSKYLGVSSTHLIRSMSNEASTCSNDMVSKIKSKQEQNDQFVVDVTEDLTIKLASQVGSSNMKKNNDADVNNESQIGTQNGLEAKHLNAECSDPLDPLSTTCMTWSKPKRKLKFGSSSCESTKRKRRITTPKSAKSTAIGKGSKDRYGSATILSPESFSGKKSRSGRVLLPPLEFWRNQTVVYDADRQVSGVVEGSYASRGKDLL